VTTALATIARIDGNRTASAVGPNNHTNGAMHQ